MPAPLKWTAKQIAMLGRYSDCEVAKRLGRCRSAVIGKRTQLGIPTWLTPGNRSRVRLEAYRRDGTYIKWDQVDWSKRDASLARDLSRSRERVGQMRKKITGLRTRES